MSIPSNNWLQKIRRPDHKEGRSIVIQLECVSEILLTVFCYRTVAVTVECYVRLTLVDLVASRRSVPLATIVTSSATATLYSPLDA